MHTIPDVLCRLTAALAALALAGCAASHGGPSGAATSAPPSGPFYGLQTATGANTAGSATRHSDDQAMCAMHRDMHNAPDQQARQAVGERHMQGMSPDERRRHMEMMRRHCR